MLHPKSPFKFTADESKRLPRPKESREKVT
jgi:hypothetical protein